MKTVYPFGGGAPLDDPRAKDKNVTGGKGANLAEMAQIGLPVPPGFTITTEECVSYLAGGSGSSDKLRGDVPARLNISKKLSANPSATKPIRCSSPSAPARGFRCPA